MKSLKIKLSLFLILAVVVSVALGGEEEVTKTYSKEYNLTDKSNVYIENRFGQVNIENWEKDAISIVIEVKVEHPNRDKAEKILNAINIEFSQSGDDISAITKIEEDMMKSWNTHFSDNSSKEFSIDWEVKMPKQTNLHIYNKYGDIFIDELSGQANIELKYGNLKANKILRDNSDPLSSLQLAYGNASIEEVNWFKFDVKYAKLTINRAKAIVSISKYSKISIEQVSSMVVESRYDTYSIGKISNLVAESGYTNYKVTELTKKLDLTTKYGDINIETIPATFESIKFDASYASIYAGIDPVASYQIEADIAYGSIKYRSPERVNRIEKPTHISIEGYVGENPNAKPKVSVNVRYGSAKFE